MKLKMKETLAKILNAIRIKSVNITYGYLHKRCGVVTLNLTNNMPATSDSATIFTIPDGFRPITNVDHVLFDTDGNKLGTLRIMSDGKVMPVFGNLKTGTLRETITYVGGYCIAVFSRLSAIFTSLLFGGDVDEGHSQKDTDKGTDITNCIINRLRVAIQRKNFISENWQNGMRLWTIICRENIDRGCLYISRNVTKWVQANGKPTCVQPRFNRSDRSRYDGVGSRRWNSENILKSHSRILGVLDNLPSITISRRRWAA